MRIVLVLFSFVSVAMAQELSFRAHDKEIQSFSLEALKKLAPAKDITVYEPHEKAKVTYSAIPARAVFEAVFKEDWKEADEILFTCEDGYQPSVPAAKFKKYAAYLSFAKPGKPFTMVNKLQNNEKIELGPYYLVWDNETFPALKAEGASDSPYQVVAIELVDFEKRFPGMTPPKKEVRKWSAGFWHFEKTAWPATPLTVTVGAKRLSSTTQ